ncbi:helix-turn-helix transcriptional regulator [Elizabethkingia meningoseptica]
MRGKIYLILLFSTFIFHFAAGQNPYTDSLLIKLKGEGTPVEERLKIYELLVDKYRSEQQYDEATAYCKEYLKLAKATKHTLETTKAYVYMGVILCNQEDYNKVHFYIDSATASASKTNDKIAEAYANFLPAYYEHSLYEYKKSVTYILKSISLLEKTKGDPILEFRLNYILYGTYTTWNDLKNSLKYAYKCVEAAKKSGNKNQLSNAYSALSTAFTYQYEKTNSKDDLKAMMDNSEKATALYYEYPGQVANYTYAIARNNKASYLLKYFPELTPDLRKQIEYNIAESLNASKNISKPQSIQAGGLGMLANLATRDHDPKKAEGYLLQSETMLLTRTPVDNYIMAQIVNDLANLYESNGDLKKAIAYQKKLTQYIGEQFNQDQASTVKKLEAQYQSQRKEQEVESLKKQKLLYLGLGIIGLIGAFFMFRSYHFRLRYSLVREKQLNTEKHEAEMQVKLEREEQARLKAEQELLSLQQQKLQNEVLANQLHIQHKNEVLQQLKTKLTDTDINIHKVVKEENRVDNEFEKAKFRIQELHPDFFRNIGEKAKQKLTPLDMKYCAYIHLGMDTKQIATLLNVEPKSVRMAKYRLKKKFGLDEETDLDTFFQSIL